MTSDHADIERRLASLELRLGEMQRDYVNGRLFEERSSRTRDSIQQVADDVKEIKEDQKAVRTLLRSTLVTAASSIIVSVILFFLLKGSM